jgi:hypothetical protein
VPVLSFLLSLILIENAPVLVLASDADTEGTPANLASVAPATAFE